MPMDLPMHRTRRNVVTGHICVHLKIYRRTVGTTLRAFAAQRRGRRMYGDNLAPAGPGPEARAGIRV